MATKPYILRRNGDVDQRDNGVRLGYLKKEVLKLGPLPVVTQWEAWAEWRTKDERQPFYLGRTASRADAARMIWDDHLNNHSLGFALVDMR